MVATTAALLCYAPAFGEAPPRVRGIVVAFDHDSIGVRQRDGELVTLKTGPATTYAYVLPSSLKEIRVSDFVGTAVKGPLDALVAVEIVLIPESLRAGRISYYPWDPLPDPAGAQASALSATRMTNGTVSSVAAARPGLRNTDMTNGLVAATRSGSTGVALTVSYDGGRKSFRIFVPSAAPVTRYVLADRSAVVMGAAVFIKTSPVDRADLVTIGKGIIPPM